MEFVASHVVKKSWHKREKRGDEPISPPSQQELLFNEDEFSGRVFILLNYEFDSGGCSVSKNMGWEMSCLCAGQMQIDDSPLLLI